MDLSFLLTPLSLSVAAILGIFLLIQFILDGRRASEQREFRKLGLASIRKHEARTVSAIIELTRGADSILPLLDHLESQAYDKLQVVVIVKHTAGKNATAMLRRYQRRHKTLKLRVVTHKKGMDRRVAVTRFATGELVVWLKGSERLSRDFFLSASLRFMNPSVDGLRVRTHVRLDSSIRSAVEAWSMVQQDMLLTTKRHAVDTAFVLRRKSYLASPITRVAYSSNVAVHVDAHGGSRGARLQLPFFGLLAVAALASIPVGSNSLIYLLAAPLLGFFLLMSSHLASTAGYRLRDRLNLILLLPLYPFLAVIFRLISLVPKLTSRRLRLLPRTS